MAASTLATKRAILGAIEEQGGEARQIEIARALGPEWTVGIPYRRLRQMMRHMETTGVLKTLGRGAYRIHPNFNRRGLSPRDLAIRQIEEFLIERCGVARTQEIHAAVGARDLTDGFRDSEHHRTTYALAQTPEKFCQPYGPGIWALTDGVRERLPLLGRWAVMELNADELDGFFEKVGEAFAEARGDLSVEAVTAQPEIREALARMANYVPDLKSKFLGELRGEVRAELAARGIDAEYSVTVETYARQDAVLAMDTYLAFEARDPGLHRVAPPEFYRGVAELFGVDAARLSRGEANSSASRAPSPSKLDTNKRQNVEESCPLSSG